MKLRFIVFILFSYFMLSASVINISAVQEFDREIKGNNYITYFEPIFDRIMSKGGVISDLTSSNDDIFMGINQGISLVTLMKLYDIYQDPYFITKALDISGFLSTYLIDLRYGLVSSFYDQSTEFISNYRYFVDNLMISWGLDNLISTMQGNPDFSELEIRDQIIRRDYVSNDLDTFVLEGKFIGGYRVDNMVIPSLFNTFDNLFSSFIITQTALFDDMIPVVKIVYDFIKNNIRSSDGGIYSLYKSGFHDNLVTLRNTGLFASVALNLYKITKDSKYLDDAKSTMAYINKYFVDVGKTGGFVEALIDNKPIQESKSLFSHAILLLTLSKLANLGVENAELQLLSVARTIFTYFRLFQDDHSIFYSSITRAGKSASTQIQVFDNLMMMFALTELPIVADAEFYNVVEFSDQVLFNVTVRIPEGVISNITIQFDDEVVGYKLVEGTGRNEVIEFKLIPPRPISTTMSVDFKINVTTQSLSIDNLGSQFNVRKDTGIILSTEVITLFSVMLIIVFVYFLKSIGTQFIPLNE